MAKCALSECSSEGSSRCSKCKATVYCGTECQVKDWPSHKKSCKKNKAKSQPSSTQQPNVPSISPFGQMFNIHSGKSTALSSRADFFAPLFGYTSEYPERVYVDLVNAYRILRSGEHMNGSLPSAQSLRTIGFDEWIDRVERAGFLPDWWSKDVNRPGLVKFAEESGLDRVVSKAEIQRSFEQPKRMLTLEMMVERVLNSS